MNKLSDASQKACNRKIRTGILKANEEKKTCTSWRTTQNSRAMEQKWAPPTIFNLFWNRSAPCRCMHSACMFSRLISGTVLYSSVVRRRISPTFIPTRDIFDIKLLNFPNPKFKQQKISRAQRKKWDKSSIPLWPAKYFQMKHGKRKQAASNSRKNGIHW